MEVNQEFVAKVKAFVLKNFLILGLLTTITFGLICPKPGQALNEMSIASIAESIGKQSLSDVAIYVIFVVSGLCLKTAACLNSPKALGLGIVLVLFVTPLLAFPILKLHDLDPSLNVSFLQGMGLFCIVPTTLSSGVTMITQANGNVALAILLTSVTNLMGVFTISWSASTIFSLQDITIDKISMLRELIVLTLFPLLVGMSLRKYSKSLEKFANDNKQQLGITQNCCILFVVLLNISKAQPNIVSADPKDILLCVTLACSVHLVYRLIGYWAATLAYLEPADWVSIVLMCSQKSLPVCVSVMTALPAVLQARSGLFIIPCIMAHAAQLIIDSLLAVRWTVTDGKFELDIKREESKKLSQGLLCY